MSQNSPIYLDHNASSPPRPEVLERALPFVTEHWGNPHSTHQLAREPAAAVDTARARVATWAGCRPREVVFTSGATEANHLALRGLGFEGAALLFSAVEHPSVRVPAADLGGEVLPVDAQGLVCLDSLRKAVESGAGLVSVMAANNETGVLQPLEEIAAIAHEGDALLHVDAAQIGGRLPAPAAWDLLTVSGHKAGGLKGAGALLYRPGISLAPQLLGGPQERGQRAGTVDVPAVVGLAEALSLAWDSARLGDLRDDLESFAVSCGAFVYGQGAPRLPNTSLLGFEGVEGQTLALALDLEGVCVSTGSACASGASEPSAVLAAMGGDPRSGLRFSLGWSTTQEEIEATKAALETVLSRIEATVAVAL